MYLLSFWASIVFKPNPLPIGHQILSRFVYKNVCVLCIAFSNAKKIGSVEKPNPDLLFNKKEPVNIYFHCECSKSFIYSEGVNFDICERRGIV